MAGSAYGIELHTAGTTDTPGDYVYVEGITSCPPPPEVMFKVTKSTEHRRTTDPNYGAEDKIVQPVTDFGTIEGEANYKAGNASQATMLSRKNSTRAGDPTWWKVVLPPAYAGAGWKFAGYLLEWTVVGSKTEDILIIKWKIEITGSTFAL